MANTIALRKAYSTMLDEVYKLASLTAVLDGPNDLVKEGANANEILIPKLSMQGLANYNKQTGYVAGDVTLEYETKKCTYDRGRMFTVDAMDNIESADVYKIRIPDNVGNADFYLPPEEYVALENPSDYWTIQNDDHIVLGVCDLKIDRPAELQAIRLRHCKVTSWSDNRFGGLPHWRIGGE